jgi:hypothetical protein
VNNETAPWSEYNHGKLITAAGLSRLLRPFDISPRTIRIGENTVKGYRHEDFEDSWKRYLRPSAAGLSNHSSSEEASAPSHTSQSRVNAVATKNSDPSQPTSVTDCISPSWADLGRPVTTVTAAEALGAKKDSVTKCPIHPNNTEWWMRGNDLICGNCHPNPNGARDAIPGLRFGYPLPQP